MTVEQIVLIAVLVEAFGESVWWVVGKDWSKERIGAAVLGLALALLTGANVLDLVGLAPASYIPPAAWTVAGVLASALLVMRGATVVHDLFSLIQKSVPR